MIPIQALKYNLSTYSNFWDRSRRPEFLFIKSRNKLERFYKGSADYDYIRITYNQDSEAVLRRLIDGSSWACGWKFNTIPLVINSSLLAIVYKKLWI